MAVNMIAVMEDHFTKWVEGRANLWQRGSYSGQYHISVLDPEIWCSISLHSDRDKGFTAAL